MTSGEQGLAPASTPRSDQGCALVDLRARAWAVTKAGEPQPARALEIAAVEMLQLGTGALTQAADHARELSDDLDRWKERAAIFEARLARFPELARKLSQLSDEARESIGVSRGDRATRLAAKASAYRHASNLVTVTLADGHGS